MNILFTSVGFGTLEADACGSEWKARHHLIEQMPMDRISRYLRFDPASTLALVDAIVCMADSGAIAYAGPERYPQLDSPLEKALAMAASGKRYPLTYSAARMRGRYGSNNVRPVPHAHTPSVTLRPRSRKFRILSMNTRTGF
jgi:hypothetical protein